MRGEVGSIRAGSERRNRGRGARRGPRRAPRSAYFFCRSASSSSGVISSGVRRVRARAEPNGSQSNPHPRHGCAFAIARAGRGGSARRASGRKRARRGRVRGASPPRAGRVRPRSARSCARARARDGAKRRGGGGEAGRERPDLGISGACGCASAVSKFRGAGLERRRFEDPSTATLVAFARAGTSKTQKASTTERAIGNIERHVLAPASHPDRALRGRSRTRGPLADSLGASHAARLDRTSRDARVVTPTARL
jgi:hypothetical protein